MRKVQTTILSLCLVILLAIVLAAIGSPIQSSDLQAAEPAVAKTGFSTMYEKASWGRDRRQMKCDRQEIDGRIDDLAAYVEGFVTFKPEQDAAWGNLIEKIRGAGSTYAELCTQFEQQQEEADTKAPERLALAEKAIAATLAAMQDARPAFDQFYATLDENQKELLDRAFSRRHHH